MSCLLRPSANQGQRFSQSFYPNLLGGYCTFLDNDGVEYFVQHHIKGLIGLWDFQSTSEPLYVAESSTEAAVFSGSHYSTSPWATEVSHSNGMTSMPALRYLSKISLGALP